MSSERLLRLPEVFERVGVSKSTWWKVCERRYFPEADKTDAEDERVEGK
jgi:predicted DNA-binding transcriptional regulator AlpA